MFDFNFIDSRRKCCELRCKSIFSIGFGSDFKFHLFSITKSLSNFLYTGLTTPNNQQTYNNWNHYFHC